MDDCLTFEDYTILEAVMPALHERPMPQEFACPHAIDEDSCYRYTPLGEKDLHETIQTLRRIPCVRCLLVTPPPPHLQFGIPVLHRHLARWCDRARPGTPFHLQPLRSNRAYPCGDEPACLTSPQVQARETAQTLSRTTAVTQQLDTQLRELFPGLEGARKKERNFDLLHAWATQEEPGNSNKPISVPTLTKKFNLKDRRTVYRILEEARELNPKVYAQLEKIRTDRARITRGGEVRQL